MDALWASDMKAIIQASTRNVHTHISDEFAPEDREERMGAMRAKLWVALADVSDQPEEKAFWKAVSLRNRQADQSGRQCGQLRERFYCLPQHSGAC